MRRSELLAFLVALGLAPEVAGRLLRQAPGVSYRQALHNYQNVQYYADFEIGGQKIAGIFDTGSFELLVRSSRCEHCAHPTPPYDHTRSHTYLDNGTLTKHVFGSGPCISRMGYETVQVGPKLTVQQQAFWEIVDHRIPVLDNAKFAAIVGIGPDFAYGNEEKTLLMSYNVDEFSVCLQKEPGSEGYLTWGAETDKLRPKDYATAKVVGKHHWVTTMQNVRFGEPKAGVTIPCSVGAGCAAIIDSGTSLIAAPGIALMQLSELIPEIKEDCSNLHLLPNLNFVVGGHQLSLPPQAYVMKVTGTTLEIDDIWDILFFKPRLRRKDICMPAFMQIDMMSQHGPVWILGMPFFRYYHTTFDRTNKAMHFAVAGPDCKPVPFRANRTEALLVVNHTLERSPVEVDVNAMVPPTLAGLMDYPFRNAGELEL